MTQQANFYDAQNDFFLLIANQGKIQTEINLRAGFCVYLSDTGQGLMENKKIGKWTEKMS